jgi:hypothetical protein
MKASTFLSATISFVGGTAVAVAVHFMLYRISLPLKPFIYVSF